jgi:multiple sugar transport system permease protein
MATLSNARIPLLPALVDRPIRKLRGLREPAALISFFTGTVARGLAYLVLVDLAFIFLFPVVYMIATSIKSFAALQDPTVRWITPYPSWINFDYAIIGLNYFNTLKNTVIIALGGAVLQVMATSFVGYGLARLNFRGREVVFWLVLFSFLVPPQTLLVGLYVLYYKLGLINNFLAFLIPAALANGIKAPLFILIFRQFYRTLPWELEEAARVDGAGTFQTYLRIVLPLAKPAVVVVFLLTLVWYWNSYWETAMFLTRPDILPLSVRLQHLAISLRERGMESVMSDGLHQGVVMAACVLIILPLLIIYGFTQRFFVQSIDRTGLVE